MAFVVYGSLVPLDYRPVPVDQAWQRFANAPLLVLGAGSRADWIANGVLYVPLGLLAARLFHRALRQWLVAIVMAWLGCVAVAFAVEYTQVFFPPRTVSQNDLVAELIGSAIGAALAPWVGGWSRRLTQPLAAGGPGVATHLLEAYALAYVVLCFFPYDLLLSRPELAAKLVSGSWGWMVALTDRAGVMVMLQLLVEAALCVPLGGLLVRRGVRMPAAVLTAAVLAVLIELGQFFIVSGISQGASVLSRVGGIATGVALWPRLAEAGWDGMRDALRRASALVFLAWLPAMLYVNGWFRSGWQGTEAAAATWRELRLLPFYYHYYTSEAVALFSLGTVALLYLPLAAIGWARAGGERGVMAGVALAALAAEASKLLLAGMRPDPTNVLIATASALLLLRLLAFAERPPVAHEPGPAAAEAPALPRACAWIAVASALSGAWLFPVFGTPLVLGLAAAAALVAWRPAAALLLVPAALPLLDLAPWSGLRLVDEFDLLLLACLGAAFARTRSRPRPSPDLGRVAWLLVAAALVIATARALWPWPGIDADSFTHPASPWMALRIAKGALWAWLFVRLWPRLDVGADARQRLFALGMAVGLLGTVLCIVWERMAFGVLTDFAADFRVTGLFSPMSKGGAYVECFLAVAMAFVLWGVLGVGARSWQRALALALFAAATYALMVTYSRNGYAALAVVVVMMMIGASVLRRGAMSSRAGWVVLALAVAAGVVVPIAVAPFASGRLEKSFADLQVRQRHWSDALALREPDLLTTLFGEGLGRFPDLHYWRTQEPVRAASFRLARDGANEFLRLGPGATIYVEQIVHPPAAQDLVLRARLRAAAGPARLGVTLCEKWTLTSLHCTAATLGGESLRDGAWHEVETRIRVPVRSDSDRPRLPTKFSLLTPAGASAVDVDDLRLLTPQGEPLLTNGDFGAGMSRWAFATDVDPPWHIHSLPLALLFDQGWFGLVAWTLLVAASVGAALRRLRRGDSTAAVALAALLAFLTSGTLNTLVDEPRFLFLLLVLTWLAGRGVDVEAPTPPLVRPRPRAKSSHRLPT